MKALNFKQIEKRILESNAKSEYKQASIVIIRNIFETHESRIVKSIRLPDTTDIKRDNKINPRSF